MAQWLCFWGVVLAVGVVSPAAEKPKGVALMKDSENCLECHAWENDGMAQSLHGRVLWHREREGKGAYCRACHRGDPHRDPLPTGAEVCLDCHRDPSRVGLRAHRDETAWHGSAHPGAGLACVTCHDVHERQPVVVDGLEGRKNLRVAQTKLCTGCHAVRTSQFRQFSHHTVGEGLLACTDCHNPHGSPTQAPSLLHTGNRALCTGCHAGKEGPFLLEHAPVTGDLAEGCVTCHDPHGANLPSLLKQQGRALCAQCHTDRFNHNPGLSCYASGCHTGVHGTNNTTAITPLSQ